MSAKRDKKKKSAVHQTNSGEPSMSLAGFQPVMWPTVFPAKLVYSDYRTLQCTGSQVEYVYRLNSVFDPDVTGVGGQPDGFDQLKTLYGRYRVVAVDVEVECVGQTANGLIAFAPSDTAGGFLSAEEIAGLRYSRAAAFTSTETAKLKARYHIGRLLGYSDESVLANTNLEAAISTNPTFQQYLVVAVEGGTSTTQSQNVWVKLTYYTRMEVPIAVNDSARVHHLRFLARGPPIPRPTVEDTPAESAVTTASSVCRACSTAGHEPDDVIPATSGGVVKVLSSSSLPVTAQATRAPLAAPRR